MKKIISLVLVLVLALTAIGGTLAYFTDTDSADNVFTVGNIDIELIEQQKGDEEGELEPFEQNKELMPGMTEDKIVTVKNIGSNDAYVRVTIVIPEGMSAIWGTETTDWTRTPAEGTGAGTYVYTSTKPLAAGAITPVLLQGVTLNADVTALDVQDTYVVPVDVEAIQAAGLTAEQAYAELTTINASTAKAENQNDLNNAVAAAEGQTTVELSAGTYTLPTMTNKEVVISGNKDTIIDLTKGNIPSTNGAEIMFSGVTVNFSEETYQGLTHTDKVVYRDCVINGTQTLYAKDVQFINCTFNVDGDAYNVWTYGAENVTFTGCTFNTDGKSILVYNEMKNASFVANVTVDGCTFNADTNMSKAVVETGVADLDGNKALNTATSNVYNIYFTGNNTVSSNFVTNNSTSNLWGNKNTMDTAHLNVFENGTEVY